MPQPLTKAALLAQLRLPAIVTTLLYMLVIGLAHVIYNNDQRDRITAVDAAVEQIESGIANQIGVLEATRGLYLGSQDVSREELVQFLTAINVGQRAPGVLGVGFAMAQERGDSEGARRMIADGYGIDRSVWPEITQAIGFPIVKLEPDNSVNRRALGYDMFSEPSRRAAMQRAWRLNQPAATGIVRLVQESDAAPQPGFLIYLPVSGGSDAVTVPGLTPLRGFVYAPVRVHDFLNQRLDSERRSALGVLVRARRNGEWVEVFRSGPQSGPVYERTLHVIDQNWQLTIHDVEGRFLFSRAFRLLFVGALISLLAGLLVFIQGRRVLALAALARERAERARDKDLLIGEMEHRLKNSFARLSALVGLTARGAADLDEFQRVFSGRLRALADSQTVLARGTGGRGRLRDLILAEMTSGGHADDARLTLSGDDVMLDEGTAQGIALILHELHTNSVKYGAFSGQGRLLLRWAVTDGTAELHWVEQGLDQTPDLSREGFGTRFVRQMAERQLRGTMTRTGGPAEFGVHIRWPHKSGA